MSKENVKVSIIVAYSNDHTIGFENRLPWTLREDLRRFRDITMDKPVIMGRKTFESLGKPLPGRTNVVVSKQSADKFPAGVVVCDTLEKAIDDAKQKAWDTGLGEVCVIGGGQIYQQAMEFADYIYTTVVIGDFEGDTKFPDIPSDKFAVSYSKQGPKPDAFNSHPTVYVSWYRK
jgi:dihydrofolate reductase